MGQIKKRLALVSSVLAIATYFSTTSCTQSANQSAALQPQDSDPAQANLAAPNQQEHVPAQSSYQSQPTKNETYDPNYSGAYDTDSQEPSEEAAQPPPPIPEYSQPQCPGDNYLWTPGYWGYARAGYYWVPGVWVTAPYVGALWTPPYWAFARGRYRWYHGYWGRHVGFYGGVNYGFGYVGRGYEGGYWNHNQFTYNRSVTNVNTTIVHNVYNYRVTNITNVRVSYNGGPGGLAVRPTAPEVAVLHETRIAPVPAQIQHARQAAANRAQFASVNNAHPRELTRAALPTSYRTPASHEESVPNVRTLPRVIAAAAPRRDVLPVQPHALEQPDARSIERHPTPPPNRTAPQARPELRPEAPRVEAPRPEPQPRVESRPAPQADPRPVPKQQPRPAPKKEDRPEPKKREEEPPR